MGTKDRWLEYACVPHLLGAVFWRVGLFPVMWLEADLLSKKNERKEKREKRKKKKKRGRERERGVGRRKGSKGEGRGRKAKKKKDERERQCLLIALATKLGKRGVNLLPSGAPAHCCLILSTPQLLLSLPANCSHNYFECECNVIWSLTVEIPQPFLPLWAHVALLCSMNSANVHSLII